MEESCGGEDRNPNKTVVEVMGDETGIVGEDLACNSNRVENHTIKGVDKERRESCSLVFGVQNSNLSVGTKLALAT